MSGTYPAHELVAGPLAFVLQQRAFATDAAREALAAWGRGYARPPLPEIGASLAGANARCRMPNAENDRPLEDAR